MTADDAGSRSDEEWIESIRGDIATIHAWQDGTSFARPHAPEGSDVAKDRVRDVAPQLDQLAWAGIATAVEHLDMLAEYLEAVFDERVALRPRAPFTLARAALLGASQTVWLLGPEAHAERVRRGLDLAWQDRQGFAGLVNGVRSDPRLSADMGPEPTKALRDEEARIRAHAKRIADKLKPMQQPTSTTKILRQAAAYLADKDGHGWRGRRISWEWGLSSGGAHALVWPFEVRDVEKHHVFGVGEYRLLTAKYSELAQSLAVAVDMTNEAIALWNLRTRVRGAAFGPAAVRNGLAAP